MFKRIVNDPSVIIVPTRSGTRYENHINLLVAAPNKESFKRSINFIYVGPTLWNNLPNYIKANNNLAEF